MMNHHGGAAFKLQTKIRNFDCHIGSIYFIEIPIKTKKSNSRSLDLHLVFINEDLPE